MIMRDIVKRSLNFVFFFFPNFNYYSFIIYYINNLINVYLLVSNMVKFKHKIDSTYSFLISETLST